MSKISFSEKGWGDYCYWQTQDKKLSKELIYYYKISVEIVLMV